ncbi:MAG: AI-2E family transporter [Gemmatimonadota bacterium]
MAFFDSSHQRAALLLALLTIGIAIALWPYATGLIGAPVLYIILAPLHARLSQRMRPSFAAGIVILIALLVIVVPGISLVTMLVGEAQDMAGKVMTGPLLGRLRELHVGPYNIGSRLVAVGESLVSWLGSSALGLVGTATRLAINLLLAFFGLYYLLLNPGGAWRGIRPYIPFSREDTDILRERFRAITISTVIGTGLTALAQGVVVALGFWFTGLSNPLFWGVVTIVFAILPVVGSGMVWGPGVAVLAFDGHTGGAAFLLIWCLATSLGIDYVLRPMLFNRFAQIHPLVTLVGAVAGVSYFGLLGLLVGPLAVSYFFEMLKMYREEYLTPGTPAEPTEDPPPPVRPPPETPAVSRAVR